MKYFMICLFFLFGGILTGCASRFLRVQDIPPYEEPSLSLTEAQEEIAFLKKKKDSQKQKIKTLRNI